MSNANLELAYNFVSYTNANIFLTGKAGTGKTTFLHNLRKKSPKRMIIVAPTGVAAINAGGVTIHSFFQISFGPQIPDIFNIDKPNSGITSRDKQNFRKLNREKINIIRSLDLLIIDEISMVRCDLLDAIDATLRRFKNHTKPFGGVQLLMIGDLQQLAPVAKEDEWEILKEYYPSIYFFDSTALKQTEFISIELTHIYRQNDQHFLEILNSIRENNVDKAITDKLNERYMPDFQPDDDDGYIILTTHNYRAQEINESRLAKLKDKPHSFKAEIEGDFQEHIYPTEHQLTLKKGAQVMFVRNDNSGNKLFYNGKIGKIIGFDNDIIEIQCPEDEQPIEVGKITWENTKYSINKETKEISETVAGTFRQYPLKLAWAITIHKSQGLTFEKAIIDAQASFAHGQVYVALSRCKSLEGLILSTPIRESSIMVDHTVHHFSNEISQNQPDIQKLAISKKNYQISLLNELFSFDDIQKKIYHLIKVFKDNERLLVQSPTNIIFEMNESFKKDIVEVSEKFQIQMKSLFPQSDDVESNKALHERITKAALYFKNKVKESIQDSISSLSIDTDNKGVRKEITKVITELGELVQFKIICLNASEKGFKMSHFLSVRSKASLEKFTLKKKTENKTSDISDFNAENAGLFDILKAWRKETAENSDLPLFMIMHQKTLFELANKLPSSLKQLKTINGLGKKKAEQFGEELLEIIQNYCVKNNIKQPDPEEHLPGHKPKEKKPKTDTKKITFDLYNEGKTVEEISTIRGFTKETIEGHLAHYVGSGELDISNFISKPKLDKITEYVVKNNYTSLTSVKQGLGDLVTWGEIRLVMKYLEYCRK